MEPVRIFIGYDPREAVAYHVFAHSILRRASVPVSIAPVALSQLRDVFNRPRSDLQSTDFSFSRFLVPWLCGFEGWALFFDCDMLMLGDVARLWNYRDERFDLLCVKHNHKPAEATKFLGAKQTSYPMKNWSSVMLMNCKAGWMLTPEYVSTASGLDLHRFNWLKKSDWDTPLEERIGELPREWNHLVGYDDPMSDELNLHWTEGGPWFKGYEHVPYAQLWRQERDDLLGIQTNR